MSRFIHYISVHLYYEFFRILSAKRSLYASSLQVSFVFMYILLGDVLMCLINVIAYGNSHSETNGNPAPQN
jgi:hypothetical protein